MPAFSLLPFLVSEELGGDALQLGWIESAFGIGTIAGGIALGVWGGTRRRILTVLPALIGLGLAPLGLVLAAPITEMVGVRSWYLTGGSVCLAMGITGFFLSSLMRIEDQPPRAARASP